MSPVVITIIGVGGSTVFGSLLGFFIKNVSERVNSIILGLCAGLMLSASVLGLLVPAFNVSNNIYFPIIGVFAGAALLSILDKLTPHLHAITGIDTEKHINNSDINKVLLFVIAIALHKFPEGMAAGVSVGKAVETSNLSVAIAISLQNIPEGMVIIAPLLLAGVSHIRTFLIALVIGMLDVAGVITGYLLGGISQAVLPFMLALSGAAMLYVVSDEMIPQSHSNGFEKDATYALIFGFVIMLMIDFL